MVKWMSIPEYTRKTGLSRNTILKLVEKGELITTTTENGGQLRIKAESDPELDKLNEEIRKANRMMRQLCEHLGIQFDTKQLF